MKFLRRELMRNMLTHWRYNLLIYFELAIIVLVGYISISNLMILMNNTAVFSDTFSERNFYMLTMKEDGFGLIVEDQALQKSMTEVKEEIYSSSGWEAYDLFSDMIFLPMDETGEKVLPEIFEIGYGDDEYYNDYEGQSLKTFVVSSKVNDIYNMKMSEGRWFTEEEYTLWEEHGYSTAAVLGSAYRDFYDIGDIIVGDESIYGAKRILTIVGFLEQGTMFGTFESNNLAPLDRYILLPIHVKKLNIDGSVIENPWIESYNVDGYTMVACKVDLETIQNEMDRITNAYGTPGIVCQQWGGTYIESTLNVSQRNIYLFSGLATLICGLAIVSLAIILFKKTEKNLRAYAVYMFSGVKPKSILLSVALEALILSILAAIPTLLVSYLEYDRLYIPMEYLYCISIPAMILSLLPACRLIMRINLDQLARRKSE